MSKTLIIPVSGGKDSQAVLSLAKKSDREIVCVHQNTGFDHPATYAQLEAMERFYQVTIEHTVSEGMLNFLERVKYFPNSAARGCTERLKQKPFAAWLRAKGYTAANAEIWFGMRSDESRTRADKYGAITMDDDICLADIGLFYGTTKTMRENIGNISVRLPIVHWSTDDVFEHLHQEKAPINALYDKGHQRVGCYPCLLARKSEWQMASKDTTGRHHIERMLQLEELWKKEKNPRKYIKVHRVWDVKDFLEGNEVRDLFADECGYCSI
jgi:3'-phosphoadenosine 5'-phosphosulfate sulfotransferase (PAPS reductase)/FAD synthetase